MEHADVPTLADLLWPTINFVIFVALIVRFLRNPIREFFRARTARLRDALEAGARARQEAEALRATLAQDARDLPALRERLRADLAATAERERQTIIELGRQAAEHLRNDARLLAAQEFAAARQALRAEVIEEGVRQATSIIRSALRPEDQERFVREFVAEARAAE